KQQVKRAPTEPRKGKVPIAWPITVRSLSEAIGVRSGELLKKLMFDHGLTVNINSVLDQDLAETLALDAGCELDVKRQETAEEEVERIRSEPDKPEDLRPRAPVVTVMGHVDHGKTSLLDRIRKSNVLDTKAAGI